MKLLLTSLFAYKSPTSLIPTAYNIAFPYRHSLYEVFPSIGHGKTDLFKEGLYDGIELDVLSSGVIDRSMMKIDQKRLALFEKQQINVESVHAAYPLIHMKVSDVHFLNLAVSHEQIVKGLKAHIQLTGRLVNKDPLLVVHLGVIPSHVPIRLAIKNVISNIRSVLKDLEKSHVTLCLENVAPITHRSGFRALGDNWETLQEVIQSINHPLVKVAYDMGHANLSARQKYDAQRNELPHMYLSEFTYHDEFIAGLNKDIVFAHLSYNSAHLLDRKMEGRLKLTGWDFHQGLNKADSHSLRSINRVIQSLISATGIKAHGEKILIEMSPSSLVRFTGFGYMGGTDSDAVKTARILKPSYDIAFK